ncbi:MAG: EamA family transporter [Deltaproteobacteria bacterium]|jgi:multidrug transporter EmrE-like cation transporter|nr:EamA family transporter [Deltaproteobacteria bacterium]
MDFLNAKWFPWLLLVGAGINTCLGNLLLKQSRLVAKPGFWPMITSYWFILGLFFYGINVILFAKALDKIPVSVAYPVFAALGFLFITFISNIIFKESITIYKTIGIILIIGGIICLSLNFSSS